ncbi:MAG TPA: c-type cytochrome [Phycisphaerae bacterium]|nr:c-type cytochrome [Phycisphaerae bacterium]HNU45303.1 c-type cytochrome [Phycisphaerae bacterium]
MKNPIRKLTWMLALFCLAGAWSCGSDVGQLFYQVGSAAGRTAIDVWLTDTVNAVLDRQEQVPDEGTDGTDGDGDGGGLIGDPERGATLFAQNNCATCHGADGGGGVVGPARGTYFQELDNLLRGQGTHTKVNLNDQAIMDLVAYLNE